MASTESIVWPPAIGMPAARHTDSPPCEDAADGLRGQHVDRHADQRQRQDRPAAHRIDIGDRVGRGDAAEVVRVVDDRHEEVGGRDQRLLVVELVHRGVVGGLDADQQLLAASACARCPSGSRTARRVRSCSRSRRRATARSAAVRRGLSGAFMRSVSSTVRSTAAAAWRARASGSNRACARRIAQPAPASIAGSSRARASRAASADASPRSK